MLIQRVICQFPLPRYSVYFLCLFRTASCLSLGRWMAWWWSAGGDTMRMMWWQQHWQWSPWSLCTEEGKWWQTLHRLSHLRVWRMFLMRLEHVWAEQRLCSVFQDSCVFRFRVARWEDRGCGRAEARCLRRRQLPVDESRPSGPLFTLVSFNGFSTYPLHNQLILAFRSLLYWTDFRGKKNYIWPPVKVWASNIQTVIFGLADVLISSLFFSPHHLSRP